MKASLFFFFFFSRVTGTFYLYYQPTVGVLHLKLYCYIWNTIINIFIIISKLFFAHHFFTHKLSLKKFLSDENLNKDFRLLQIGVANARFVKTPWTYTLKLITSAFLHAGAQPWGTLKVKEPQSQGRVACERKM